MSLNPQQKEIIKILKKDGVGIMPTDTLYGFVGGAFSKKAIEKIYKLKKRDKKKKLIILISSILDLKKFKVSLSKKQLILLKKVWPGKVSVILNNTAFRLPADKSLIEILKKAGPLVAPSANPEGLKPAQNISQAKKYFGNKVDFYLSGKTLKSKPSVLIKLSKDGTKEVLRGILK
jgi:L-threonylcarbamoyladenylate synthase